MVKNIKKILKHQHGQSIVEYIILVAVVIVALLIFLGRDGMFEQTYNDTVGSSGSGLSSMADKIFN